MSTNCGHDHCGRCCGGSCTGCGALELTQDELSAYLNDSAVQKSHSNRFDSSYLLCKEKDGSTIVVWFESEADIAEKTELCKLLGI